MKLTQLSVRNFRGLQNIVVNFDSRANVIVGPNAIGKTTVLEAIRLAKAVLAPRVYDEGQHALITLGAVSPHNPQRLNYEALCGTDTQPVNISCTFELNSTEIASLDSLGSEIATSIVRASMGFNPQAGPIPLVQFLSSPQGRTALASAKTLVDGALPVIKNRSRLVLDLTIDPATQQMRGTNHLDQLVFSALEARLSPFQALFSYFPADRALPVGEVPIQVGGPDVTAQLQSHNAQPQSKYNRLKATIVNSSLFGIETKISLDKEFKKIFSSVLKDREMIGVSLNQFGLVNIRIKQIADGRVFDIDAMSSGEKGLILTFLLISRSVADGGIILIDEPELHLNPAVCKLLLPFMIDEYLVPRNIQAILCSHSPDVLGAAFDRTDCSLHHLQSSTVISKIYPEDKREIFDALRHLGTSASDVLFSSGSIFVEGEHDIEILEAGFSKTLSRYTVTHLGGRGPVEREIKTLQQAEEKGEIDTLKCFIFDLDRVPTSLGSTKLVKVLQWKRRCLENYLIDEKVIYDLLREQDISLKSIPSRGEVPAVFKEIAISQLPALVVDKVYKDLAYENSGFRPKEVASKDYADSAQTLFDRLEKIKAQLCTLERSGWCSDFETRCNAEYSLELAKWEVDWLVLCDGKRFFKDVHSRFEVKISPLKLKKLIIERMEKEQLVGWVLVEKLITEAIRI